MQLQLWENMKNKYYERKYGKEFNERLKQEEKDKTRLDDINEQITPIEYTETKDGRYLKTNDTYIQCLKVGMLSGKFKDRQEYPSNLNPRIIDEILEIGTTKATCIEMCQVICPLPADGENEALEKARRSIELASAMQEEKDKVLHKHEKTNDYAAEDIDKIQRGIYDGTTRLFHHVLLVAVQGLTKKDVDKTINSIITFLDSNRILNELPIRGMKKTYDSMMLNPYVWQKVFKKSSPVEFCAKTSLLRNPEPFLANSGRFIGMNEKTGNPIFINQNDPTTICGHALEIGMSGSGKSTDLLKDDIRAYLDGDNVVHVVPKKDGITNHLRVCEALNGQLIKFGDFNATPNMLQVFFDPSTMDTSQDGYQAAYLAHFTMLLESIGLLVGSGYTEPQKNWLYDALSVLFEDFHVIDSNGRVINTDKWQDGEFWPDFEDLRAILEGWLNDGKHKNVSGPIEALYNNTKMLTRRGPLGYLVNKNRLDLSNRLIMADLSALSSVPNIQEAMTMMLMSIVYTKLSCSKPGMETPTLLTLDEGADLVKNTTMEKNIEKFFRQGRSWKLRIKIVSQDLEGFPSSMLGMIKTNTDYVVLLGNMRGDNVGNIAREFSLTPDETARLCEPGAGRGLMLIGGTRIHYLNVLDDFEKMVIFGTDKLDFDEKEEQETSFQIDPKVEKVVKECGILPKEWIENMKEYPNGYEKETETNPITGKRTVVFFKRTLVKEDGHIKNQTKKHYFTAGMLGGECLREGALSVSFDDYGRATLPGTDQKQVADVVAVFPLPNGRTYTVAFEIETPECKHSKKDLQEKREALKTKEYNDRACFDDVMFIGQHEHIPFLIDALGSDFVLQRGSEVAEYIQKIKTGNLDVLQPQPAAQSAEAA